MCTRRVGSIPTRSSSKARWWIEQKLRPLLTIGCPFLGIGDDMRRVEEPHLAEPADCAAVLVGGEHGAAELSLVDSLLDLADDVTPLDRVRDVDRLALVVRPAHLPEGQEDAALGGLVLLDVGRVDRPVPVRPRADEVDERHVEEVRTPEPAVEVVLRVVALVAVEDAVRRLLVLVPDLSRRAVDGEGGGPALRVSSAVDPVGAVEERDAPPRKLNPSASAAYGTSAPHFAWSTSSAAKHELLTSSSRTRQILDGRANGVKASCG